VSEIQLEKPLKLVRTKVIEKLEENFKKAKDARAEAAAAEAEAREVFDTFVKDHQEQIANYLRSALVGGRSWAQAVEQAETTFDGDNYKTPESVPTVMESELEKLVRVLKMTSEDTIEVKPTQRVYDLL
jgi:hypothetical protein